VCGLTFKGRSERGGPKKKTPHEGKGRRGQEREKAHLTSHENKSKRLDSFQEQHFEDLSGPSFNKTSSKIAEAGGANRRHEGRPGRKRQEKEDGLKRKTGREPSHNPLEEDSLQRG